MQRHVDHATPLACASADMTSIPPNIALLVSLMSNDQNSLLSGGALAVPEQTQPLHLALGSEELTQQLLAMVSAQLSYLQLSQQGQQAASVETSVGDCPVAHALTQVRIAGRPLRGIDCVC